MVLEAQERARELVRRHRERLEAAAARLLTVEVVEEEELTRLWGPKVGRPGGDLPVRAAAAAPEPAGPQAALPGTGTV
jgi:hypothetical protein